MNTLLKALLPDTEWSDLLSKLKGKNWGFYQQRGNVGDDMIFEGTRQLFSRNNIAWSHWEQEGSYDGVLISGGGNLGTAYGLHIIRKKLFRETELQGIETIILPQTFTGGIERIPDWVTVYVREKQSLCFPNSFLLPDMSFAYTPDFSLPERKKQTGIFLRKDREAIFSEIPSIGDPVHLFPTVYEFLKAAASFSLLITDRLHFAIAGLLMKTRVILLPNIYFKNRSIWETWLKNFGCEWRENPWNI